MPKAKNMAARKSKQDDFALIEIEEGSDDRIHEAVLKASREYGHTDRIREADIWHGHGGKIKFVRVPSGLPVWRYWDPVPGTDTYRVIDQRQGKMWLFRDLQFRSERPTTGIMAAQDPWLYEYRIDPAMATRYSYWRPSFRVIEADGSTKVAPTKENIIIWPDGLEEIVNLPEGFPTWNKWKVVSGNETFQAVDLATKKMYLYRQQFFQRCELTQGILEADDPLFYREGIPRVQLVEVRHFTTKAQPAGEEGSDKQTAGHQQASPK